MPAPSRGRRSPRSGSGRRWGSRSHPRRDYRHVGRPQRAERPTPAVSRLALDVEPTFRPVGHGDADWRAAVRGEEAKEDREGHTSSSSQRGASGIGRSFLPLHACRIARPNICRPAAGPSRLCQVAFQVGLGHLFAHDVAARAARLALRTASRRCGVAAYLQGSLGAGKRARREKHEGVGAHHSHRSPLARRAPWRWMRRGTIFPASAIWSLICQISQRRAARLGHLSGLCQP